MKIFTKLIYSWFLLIVFTPDSSLQLEKDLLINDEGFYASSSSLIVTANSKGTIFAANPDINTIFMFSPDGAKKKELSQEGRGPGEFMHLGDLFMDANDTLYALDRDYGKVTVFIPPAYEVQEEYSIPTNVNNQRPEHLLVTPDSDILVAYSEILSIQNPENTPNTLYSIDTDKTGIQHEVFSYADHQLFIYTDGNTITTSNVPFGYKSKLAMGPKGKIYWGKTDRDKIQVFSNEGHLENEINLPNQTVKIPSEMIAQYKEAVSMGGNMSPVEKKILSIIPDVYPIYNWFVVDDKNRSWLALTTADENTYRLVVYAENGDKRGETTLPTTVELQTVKGAYAYGTLYNSEEGVESIVRYNINSLHKAN